MFPDTSPGPARAYLQLPPQATLEAADTVHYLRNVPEVEPKFLLGEKTCEWMVVTSSLELLPCVNPGLGAKFSWAELGKRLLEWGSQQRPTTEPAGCGYPRAK